MLTSSFDKSTSRSKSKLLASAAVSEYFRFIEIDAKEAAELEAEREAEDAIFDDWEYELGRDYRDDDYSYDDPYYDHHSEGDDLDWRFDYDYDFPVYAGKPLAEPLPVEDAGKSLGELLAEALKK